MGICTSFALSICAALVFEALLNWQTGNKEVSEIVSDDFLPLKYKIYPDIKSTGNHLQHVVRLLERMGYQKASDNDFHWHLLWAHEYPFLNTSQNMNRLLQHQIVNHYPGIGFITSKVHLSTGALPFMPKAFHLPTQKDEFLRYAQSNPDILFVVKHNKHRFVSIRPPNLINLNSTDTFIQEFIRNPFLVDGHKFDIGVYVVLTSVDPLIIYMYAGDVLFRYCLAKYDPFDPKDVDKYVVGSDYLPTWEVPSLMKYYKHFEGSMRATFDAYVRDQSLDPSLIWVQVEEVIRKTILSKISEISNSSKYYKSGIFFELLRFDFIVDDTLKVYLMEVNMSPNLSSMHFKQNSLLYDQLLYSVFHLVGIGSSVQINKKIFNEDEIITSNRNIVINLNKCVEFSCNKSCTKPECQLCLPCLTAKQINILKKAHYGHLHKIDMKRIFPKEVIDPENFDIKEEVQNLSTKNAWLTRWFYGKCREQRNWCK